MKLLLFLPFLPPVALAIWPLPSSLSTGNSTLWIDEDVAITYHGPNQVGYIHFQDEPNQYALHASADRTVTQTASYSSYGNTTSGESSFTSSIIRAAISRTSQTLFQQNFVPWKFHPRNSNFEPAPGSGASIRSITLQQTSLDPSNIVNPHAGDIDESYTLDVTVSGDVTITGASSFGIAHGLTTFTQLFYQSYSGGVYTTSAPVSITDAPLFPHRGMNMDLSRNAFAMSDIERMIDALAYNKFNRMHLHITDSQSWPLQIPSLPDLAAKGAYRSDLSYSPAQVQQIQYYGFLQGVSVYLEIDSPGHSASIAYSYPDLIASFNIQPNWDDYAAEPPSGTLKLNSTAVYDFMNTVYGDLLPRISPWSAYFHSGGDEVNQNAYLNDDTVRSNETSVLQPLIQKFVDRNHDQIRANGMTPVVWEEMLLTWNLTLGSDVVVQTWESDQSVASTTAQGHYALAGNYNFWYLDCGQGQWINFPTGPLSEEFWPFADYCSPRKNWRLMYSYDPLAGVPAANQHLVLGGECHIWAEQTDPVSLDRMVWPRAAAAAEVLWSGAKDASGQNRSQVEAAPRLSEMRERLVAKGVMAEPIQMPFCLMSPDQCTMPSS